MNKKRNTSWTKFISQIAFFTQSLIIKGMDKLIILCKLHRYKIKFRNVLRPTRLLFCR